MATLKDNPRRLRRRALNRLGSVLAFGCVLHAAFAHGATFDFDTGNAGRDVIIPRARAAIFTTVSPGGSDAPLVLRITTLGLNAWFDAIAPYHPTAVGVYSRLGRRPASESATNRNLNIAMLYAAYQVLNRLLPQHTRDWRAMLADVGLDPDDAREDTTTAIGLGNLAGRAVVAARERDGMNQLGDEGEQTSDRHPYADYLGYRPVNTAYELRDPSRWQPAIVTMGNGIFRVQHFLTPQWRVTRPYSYPTPEAFRAPVPVDSQHGQGGGYQQQADEVLAASAALTDRQKMTAEFFDNKNRSLGSSASFASQAQGLTLAQYVHYVLVTNVAAFDGGIATWNEKYRYDAVRPFSAIRYLYGDRQGWRSYLPTADHPEYPSGSACFCAAHAQASRRFLGSDVLGWSVPIAAGSSQVEPGITPASDLSLGPWDTWTAFAHECGLSRLWGGVHFMAAITAGHDLCHPIGDLAYEFVQAHIDGNVPE
jgi:hypothetical protein